MAYGKGFVPGSNRKNGAERRQQLMQMNQQGVSSKPAFDTKTLDQATKSALGDPVLKEVAAAIVSCGGKIECTRPAGAKQIQVVYRSAKGHGTTYNVVVGGDGTFKQKEIARNLSALNR